MLTKQTIDSYLKTVRAPGEEPDEIDDRIPFGHAVILAETLGDEGKPLMDAIEEMKHDTAVDVLLDGTREQMLKLDGVSYWVSSDNRAILIKSGSLYSHVDTEMSEVNCIKYFGNEHTFDRRNDQLSE